VDYTQGVFIVNEDWYGHNNSTLNHLDPEAADGDYWTYRVMRQENPGMEIGSTAQVGAVHNGRLYLIAKQPKDPGASINGGRITIADATTLKILKQIERIDESGSRCDGRGFVGVDAGKGYVSSSNGVWILDLDRMCVTGRVAGTENPFAEDSPELHAVHPGGELYHGQCGTMVTAAERVFVAHQSKGLVVIDPSVDAMTDVISIATTLRDAGAWVPTSEQAAQIEAGETSDDETGPGIGSVVVAKDGSLWVSVAEDASGQGVSYPALIRVDPSDLSTEVIRLPDDMPGPQSSWYAWTPDAFCASNVTDCIYWKGNGTRWFGGSRLFRFDTKSRSGSLLVDTMDKEQGEWGIYGCSMRVHPSTDEIYVSLYKDFINETYLLRRYSADGDIIKDYPMISNYWFPSMPVFPESAWPSSIVGVSADRDAVVEPVSGNRLRVRAMRGADGIALTPAGQCVARFDIPDDDFILTLDLPHGIYVIRIGDVTLKHVIN